MAKALGFEYKHLKLHTVCLNCFGEEEEIFCQKKKKEKKSERDRENLHLLRLGNQYAEFGKHVSKLLSVGGNNYVLE